MPWMKLTFGNCGHQADIDEFCRTPVFGELPANVYQCPACSPAIERRSAPPPLMPSGWVKPGIITLVPVGARL